MIDQSAAEDLIQHMLSTVTHMERVIAAAEEKRRRERLHNATAQEVMDAMPPVQGETRTVSQCPECGRLFGRQFIPYAMGQGLTVNTCLHVATDANVQRRAAVILESNP